MLVEVLERNKLSYLDIIFLYNLLKFFKNKYSFNIISLYFLSSVVLKAHVSCFIKKFAILVGIGVY